MTLFIAIIGHSQTFTENFITYSVTSSNTVTVTNYNIAGGTNVVIPASVTETATSKMSSSKSANNLMATYNVTGIGQNAFFTKGITSVVIPNSVLTIGSQAFAVNFITSAILGNSVTTIGISAFYNNNLTTIMVESSSAYTLGLGTSVLFLFASAIAASKVPNTNASDLTRVVASGKWRGYAAAR